MKSIHSGGVGFLQRLTDETRTTTEQIRRHDEAAGGKHAEMCASVSGHTFHLLASSALGTLLVSERSMRMEKHKGQKEKV